MGDFIPMKFFLCVIGMVMIIEGLPYFVFPERLKAWLQKISEMEPNTLRLLGFLSMVLGAILVYANRPS